MHFLRGCCRKTVLATKFRASFATASVVKELLCQHRQKKKPIVSASSAILKTIGKKSTNTGAIGTLSARKKVNARAVEKNCGQTSLSYAKIVWNAHANTTRAKNLSQRE
jgi:hypothetical protein